MLINQATNPSFEVSTANTAAIPGTSGTAAVTSAAPSTTTAFGTKVLKTTWTVATTAAGGGAYEDVNASPGQVLSFGFGHVKASIATRLQLIVEWYNGASLLSSSNGDVAAVTAGGTPIALTLLNATAPASTTKARVKVISVTGTGFANWSISSYLELDGLMVNLGATLATYFDGSSTGGFWTGTVGLSTSEKPNLTPVLTLFADANPCPRLQVQLPELPTVAATVTVSRIESGRTFKVRGGISLFAGGGTSVLDFEVPFGVSAKYRAEMFDSNGVSLGLTLATSITVDPAAVMTPVVGGAIGRVWIHQPLQPSLAIQATLLGSTADAVVRTNPGDVFFPEGATVGVRIGGQRRGLSGTTVRILVDSVADGDEFQSMFGGYSSDFPAVVCIRTAPPIRLPRTLFAAADPSEVDVRNVSYLTYEMSVDEVQPPAPGLVIPTLRRDDIDIAFATRDARAAAYATRLARDTDYSKAGLAG